MCVSICHLETPPRICGTVLHLNLSWNLISTEPGLEPIRKIIICAYKIIIIREKKFMCTK